MFYTLLGFIVGAIWSYYLKDLYKTTSNIEKLKNALLTLSLIKVKANDFSNTHDYKNYNGTQLPPLNNINLNTACFTYILDIHEFRNSNLYSNLMETRLLAIDKYLNKNLASEQQVMEFFNSFKYF